MAASNPLAAELLKTRTIPACTRHSAHARMSDPIKSLLDDPVVSAAWDKSWVGKYKAAQMKSEPGRAEAYEAECQYELATALLTAAVNTGFLTAQAVRLQDGDPGPAGAPVIHGVIHDPAGPAPEAAGGSSGVARVDLTEESD